MDEEDFSNQTALDDAIDWVKQFGAPQPELVTTQVGWFGGSYYDHELVFTKGPARIIVDAVLFLYNPAVAFQELLNSNIVTGFKGTIPAYIPPTHDTPPVPPPTFDPSEAVGDIIPNGHNLKQRILVAKYYKTFKMGDIVEAYGKDWQLVPSGSPFNPTGVWQEV